MDKYVKKVLVGLAVGLLTLVYVVSPVDLIPDVIPCAGYMDDAVAVLGNLAYWAYVAYTLVKTVSKKRGSKNANSGPSTPAGKKDQPQ